MSFFNTAPAAPAPLAASPNANLPGFPVPQYAPPPVAAPAYAPAPAAPAQSRAFNPHAAEAVIGLIGGEPVNPGANTAKLKTGPLGQYKLRIVNVTSFNGYKIGPAIAVDFEVIESTNGVTGVRSHLFPLTGVGEAARYRADDVANFLVAVGCDRAQTQGAFRALLADLTIMNGRSVGAEVLTGRKNPAYNDILFIRMA